MPSRRTRNCLLLTRIVSVSPSLTFTTRPVKSASARHGAARTASTRLSAEPCAISNAPNLGRVDSRATFAPHATALVRADIAAAVALTGFESPRGDAQYP